MEVWFVVAIKDTGLVSPLPSIQIYVSSGTDDNRFEEKVFFFAKDHDFLQMQLGAHSPSVEKFTVVIPVSVKESDTQSLALLL